MADSIITISTSVGEAEDAVSELKASITQVLESNQVLAERMANLELQHSAHALSEAPDSTQDVEHYRGKRETTLRQRELLFGDGETSTDSSIAAPNDKVEDQDNESIVTVRRIGPATSQILTAVDGFAFEQDLFASRPYARAIKRRPCQSATSSVVPSMGWSYLSGLSLADVSEVSILSLPLTPQELWNGLRYVTARDNLEDSAGDRRQQRQASVARTRSMTTFKFSAASSRLFGKLFDRRNSFPDMKKTDKQMISSRNVVLLGAIYIHKIIIQSNSAALITDREKECLFRANAQSIDNYNYFMEMDLMRLIACKPVVPSSVTSLRRAWWRGTGYRFQRLMITYRHTTLKKYLRHLVFSC